MDYEDRNAISQLDLQSSVTLHSYSIHTIMSVVNGITYVRFEILNGADNLHWLLP